MEVIFISEAELNHAYGLVNILFKEGKVDSSDIWEYHTNRGKVIEFIYDLSLNKYKKRGYWRVNSNIQLVEKNYDYNN